MILILFHKQHGHAHMMAVQAISSATMAMYQSQSEGRDGGYGSAQPTTGAFPSAIPIQDLQPIECNICEKRFKTENALNVVSVQVLSSKIVRSSDSRCQHLANPLSHQLRTMACPVKNSNCRGMFKSASGIAHHVESEKVHRDITRHQVTKAVKALDTNGTISIKRHITSSTTTPLFFTDTEAAFNGSRYVCSLCGKGRFKTLIALNSHLNSPAHDANEFKCPICEKEFKVVSALMQHAENGCARRRLTNLDELSAQEAERYIDDLTSRFTSPNRIQM